MWRKGRGETLLWQYGEGRDIALVTWKGERYCSEDMGDVALETREGEMHCSGDNVRGESFTLETRGGVVSMHTLFVPLA